MNSYPYKYYKLESRPVFPSVFYAFIATSDTLIPEECVELGQKLDNNIFCNFKDIYVSIIIGTNFAKSITFIKGITFLPRPKIGNTGSHSQAF